MRSIRCGLIVCLIAVLAALLAAPPAQAAEMRAASGKIVFLRLQSGGGYGPPQDFLDVEVVVKVEGNPAAMGFQLRNDTQGPVHEAMYALLRDAFRNNWPVTLEYMSDPGKANGVLFRAYVSK